jgi:hypothetical protein
MLPIGKPPPPEFYSAAAGIIPLLIIALALEGRARDVWDPYPGYIRFTVIVALCLGELAGILGASGVISNFNARDQEGYGLVGPGFGSSEAIGALTAYALIIGFGAVVWVALVHRDQPGRSTGDDRQGGIHVRWFGCERGHRFGVVTESIGDSAVTCPACGSDHLTERGKA